MQKHIIKTEFENMFDNTIELYKCPCCKKEIFNNDKWLTEHFTRFYCDNCDTYIYIADKNCNINEIEKDDIL